MQASKPRRGRIFQFDPFFGQIVARQERVIFGNLGINQGIKRDQITQCDLHDRTISQYHSISVDQLNIVACIGPCANVCTRKNRVDTAKRALDTWRKISADLALNLNRIRAHLVQNSRLAINVDYRIILLIKLRIN